MFGGDVKAATPFPEPFSRLLLGPFCNAVDKVVPVTGVADVHLPVPEVVVFRMLICKVLHWHESAAVDAMDGQVTHEGLFKATIY